MGMDLKPINPSLDAPRNENGEVIWGRYNWRGWGFLCDFLCKAGLNPDELGFSGLNDGHVITEENCKKVADAIEQNLHTLEEDEDKEWLSEHIVRWRTCGGYEQW